MKAPTRRWLSLGITFLVVSYVGSYIVLSRLGSARADASRWTGFYFVEPHPDHDERAWLAANETCVFLFYPLIQVERLLGTGREPARSAPMWRLGGGKGAVTEDELP